LEGRQIKVIGLGGVGAGVAQAVAQFLATRQASCSLWLIDGDSYEERNRERVIFRSYDNKAVAKAHEFTVATGNRITVIPPLTRFHPEIARARDKSPAQMGCADLAAQSAPQLLFTNMAVASAMLGAFYGWLHGKLNYEEVYLDISLGRMTPVRRSLAARRRPPDETFHALFDNLS
jgi:hypothetical protein